MRILWRRCETCGAGRGQIKAVSASAVGTDLQPLSSTPTGRWLVLPLCYATSYRYSSTFFRQYSVGHLHCCIIFLYIYIKHTFQVPTKSWWSWILILAIGLY